MNSFHIRSEEDTPSVGSFLKLFGTGFGTHLWRTQRDGEPTMSTSTRRIRDAIDQIELIMPTSKSALNLSIKLHWQIGRLVLVRYDCGLPEKRQKPGAQPIDPT